MKEQKKIVLYGASLHNNLGGPSIYEGINQVLKDKYKTYSITYVNDLGNSKHKIKGQKHYQEILFSKDVISTFFWIISVFFNSPIFLNKSQKQIFRAIKTSDLTINCWGIAYSDKLRKRGIMSTIWPDMIAMLSKKNKVLTVHYTASFGPIKFGRTKYSIKKALNNYFDLIIARENRSKDELLDKGIKTSIIVKPDTGLLLPIKKEIDWPAFDEDKKYIGISVSYQMRKQWSNTIDYVEYISQIANFLIKETNCNIILFPNDFDENIIDDYTVAAEINKKIIDKSKVEIFELYNFSASSFKYYISKCEIVVASRYHTVVASLSSKVPVFVIGWHYKYKELLSHFNQEQFFVDESGEEINTCNSRILELWKSREKNKKEIEANWDKVVVNILDVKLSPKLDE